MTLRRLCYLLSTVASVLAIIAELGTAGLDRPLLWVAVAVGFFALAGVVD